MNTLFGSAPGGAKAGAAFSVAVCLYIAVSLVVSLAVESAGLSGDAYAYLSYLCSPIAIGIALAVFPVLLNCPLRACVRVRCRPRYFLIAVLAAFGLLFAVSPLNSLFSAFIRSLGYVPSQSVIPSLEGWGLAGALLVIAVLPALAEELLFRGVIFSNLRGSSGGAAAIFLSAFVFTLYHGSVEQTVYQFVCGCAFAFIALRSGSVAPSALAHFLNNGVIIVMQAFFTDESGNLMMPGWAYAVVVPLAVVCLAAGAFMLFSDRNGGCRGERGQVKYFFAWGSAGMFVMALIWVLGLFPSA